MSGDAQWVAALLGQINDKMPHETALAIVYGVTATLNAEIENQKIRGQLKEVAYAVGVQKGTFDEVLKAIALLKKQKSRAHSKTVLDRWAKAKPRRKR